MQASRDSITAMRPLLLTLGATYGTILLFATASWGQNSDPLSENSHIAAEFSSPNWGLGITGETPVRRDWELWELARELEPLPNGKESFSPTRRVDSSPASRDLQREGLAQPVAEKFSTRAADLLPTEVSQDVEEGDTPKPTGGEIQIPFSSGDKPFAFGFGSLIGEPTALYGPTREPVVSTLTNRLSAISIGAFLRQRIGTNQALLLEAIGDTTLLGFDLSYTISPQTLPGAFSINFFNQRSRVPAFEEGDPEVELPNGDSPWVHRMGGGIEYFRPLATNLDVAMAVNYQRVSVRDGIFTSDIEPLDEFGNKLTFSDGGQDDLLTLNLAGLYDTTDNRNYPTRGSRVRFGVDQSIPVGSASITFTRFSGNFTQFIPFNLFGFREGPRTLVLNFQAGTMLGDVPPYEAYNLGGNSSVRGFGTGEIGTGSSFIQATAEYRFPIFTFNAFQLQFDVGGVFFVDYGSDLGTADDVTGRPAEVRDKPGDGLGYGFGLNARSPIGLLRFEFGFNDDGGNEVHFAVGDRF